jgi:hypothetical protein
MVLGVTVPTDDHGSIRHFPTVYVMLVKWRNGATPRTDDFGRARRTIATVDALDVVPAAQRRRVTLAAPATLIIKLHAAAYAASRSRR